MVFFHSLKVANFILQFGANFILQFGKKKQYKSGISFCYHVGTMVACFGAESIYDRRLGLGKI